MVTRATVMPRPAKLARHTRDTREPRRCARNPGRRVCSCSGHGKIVAPALPGSGAVIAEYRDVALVVERHGGRVRFQARLERRLAHFWRCRCEARAADGRVLLASRVTLAPGQDGLR